MSDPNQPVLDFLNTRRSRSPKTLIAPAPNDDEVAELLTIAARSPDHKMLEPWRFIVLNDQACTRVAGQAVAWGAAHGFAEDKVEKTAMVFNSSPLCVAVVYSPKHGTAVPLEEQVLSTGAVCLALVNGALASGWGAGWITGWASFDTGFCAQALGLTGDEYVAGYVHIGTETVIPKDRNRPDINIKTQWVTE